MTPLSRAEQAVTEARRDVHEYFVLLAATNADQARATVSRLEAAIRRHDAEIVRAMDPIEIALAGQYAPGDIARALDPDKPEPGRSRVPFGPTEGLTAPADACPLHSPTGSPCDCGHDGGDDCHPKES